MNTRSNHSVFGGPAYEPKADRSRLSLQIERIRCYMLGVEWRTLGEICRQLELLYRPANFPEGSVSAQLRNLKKEPYRCRLEKRRRGDPSKGLWEYRLHPAVPLAPQRELFNETEIRT